LKRLFDHDPQTGVTEIFHYDPMTGDARIETVQDVSPEIELNKALQNNEDYTKHGIKNEMWHYANIPVVIQLQWLQKYGPENDPMKKGNEKLLFRLLNDPEWRHLKTTTKIHLGR
jgi:hypothetical protein